MKRFTLLLLLFCLSSIIKTAAQLPTDTSAYKGNSYAMIIGISSYKYIMPLNYADQDAVLFRDFLTSPGGGNLDSTQIFCLLNEDAKAANFWVKGMNWLRSKKLTKGDRLYLYLAGHGDAINQDEYFFLTYDCNPAGDKNNYIITGNIQLFNLKSRISQMVQSGVEVILIMDACRTNELPGGSDGQQLLTNAISEKQAGEIIMLATGAGQESLEDASIGTGHGLFTYYLVDGLSGLADRKGNSDAKISLGELQTYIKNNVPVIAQEKYNRKQDPFICCDDNAEKNIASVDSIFLNKWSLAKQLKGLSGTEMDAIARNVKTRGSNEVIDSSFLVTYTLFNKAIKHLNLTGSDTSAEAYFLKLNSLDPNGILTKEARAALAAEFINYAQTKINLYLEGKDITTIQKMRSQFDDLGESEDISLVLNRMEKIAKQEFTQTGEMLEKAIGYLDPNDSLIAKVLVGKVYFFKAHGFFDKGNKTMDYVLAKKYALLANQYDNNAAYTLNTLASLYIQSSQYDSAIFYAAKAKDIAPRWRFPYLNLAYSFSRTNEKDSALLYYRKAITIDNLNADAYVDIGSFFHRSRDLDSAIDYYQKAIKVDAKNLHAYNNMGWALKEKREYPKAIEQFRRTLELDPYYFSAYNGLSKIYIEMKQYDSARIYYEKAMQRYPDKMLTTNYLGNFYKTIKKFDSALYYYKQAVYYDLDDNIPYLNIGKTYIDLKQYDSAAAYYKYAAQANSQSVFAWNQMGMLYRQLKKYDSAIVYFTKAHELLPEFTPTLNNLALTHLERREFVQASQYYNKALKLDPYNAHLYNNAAIIYKEQFKMDSAKSYFKKAIGLNPSITSAYNNLGWIYRTQHKYDSAKAIFKEGIEKNPYNTDALNNLVLLYRYLTQFDSAKIYYLQNIEKYPGNPAALNSLGIFYFDIKSYDSSITAYKKAIALDPTYATAYNNIGAVYNEISWYDSAIYFYKKAIELDPEYVNARFNLGMSYYNFSKWDSAITYLSDAVKLNPQQGYYNYFLAGAFAMKQMVPESLDHLRIALKKGYNDYYTVLHDGDLKNIRLTKEYLQLVKEFVPEKYIKQYEEENRKALEGQKQPAEPKKKKGQ